MYLRALHKALNSPKDFGGGVSGPISRAQGFQGCRQHPRGCGGNVGAAVAAAFVGGAPPRMRGQHLGLPHTEFRLGCTPRMRGQHKLLQQLTVLCRWTPAGAGSTLPAPGIVHRPGPNRRKTAPAGFCRTLADQCAARRPSGPGCLDMAGRVPCAARKTRTRRRCGACCVWDGKIHPSGAAATDRRLPGRFVPSAEIHGVHRAGFATWMHCSSVPDAQAPALISSAR